MSLLGARQVLRVILMLLAFLLLGLPARVCASPAEDLQAAHESFRASDYNAAIAQFSALLYPRSQLADAGEIAVAHLFLGVAYFETGKVSSAEEEFEEALFLDDSLTVEANLFSPEVVRFFSKKKRSIQKQAEDAAERERLARKQQALDRALANLVVLEKRRYWVNYVPFGAGQFQNGQRRKGLAFFSAEAVTGGLSVGLWSYQIIKYGFRGKVPRDEVDQVNTIQILQVSSGAIFFGLVAWGIVDSLSNYEHTVKREADPALLEDLKDIFETQSSLRPRVLPMIGPDSQGVTLGWEF